ncbi:MAG: hypothetical protein MUF34_22345 [Polyangiaceae bacterium]|jgi:hypothetical protein|nr:hypothetical protein [Polyangiaceae bacterium]
MVIVKGFGVFRKLGLWYGAKSPDLPPWGGPGKLAKKMLARFARFRVSYVAFLATTLGACSVSVWSNEEQCENDGDCVRRGGVFANTTCSSGLCAVPAASGGGVAAHSWACLQNAGRGGAGGGGVVQVGFRGVRLDADVPLVGASVRPCLKNDTMCSLVVAEAQITDESGKASFELPVGFDGYFEVTRADLSTALLFAGSIVRDTELPAVAGITAAEGESLSTFVPMPSGGFSSQGVAILSASDCAGVPAAGVVFTVDVDAATIAPFFIINGAPNTSLSETAADGRGGFLGLPQPSFLLFRATRVSTGERIAEVSAFTRLNSYTFVALSPSP